MTSDGWVLCGKCGKKLARITDKDLWQKLITREQEEGSTGAILEFKCSSCKIVNEL